MDPQDDRAEIVQSLSSAQEKVQKKKSKRKRLNSRKARRKKHGLMTRLKRREPLSLWQTR
jgi:hypothetical protein